MCNDVIKLIKQTHTVNEYGDDTVVETVREVFAERKSIGMKETYEAMAVGLKPDMTFVLEDYYDYEDEDIVEYNGVRYRVTRTYITTSNSIELVVSRSVDA